MKYINVDFTRIQISVKYYKKWTKYNVILN